MTWQQCPDPAIFYSKAVTQSIQMRSSRPLLLSGLFALAWLVTACLLASALGVPSPNAHDEFSYLLQADTFSRWRLTNPELPLSQFFESPHILTSPTYSSKYPPGQALWLSAGQILCGAPYEGVLLQGFTLVFATVLMLSTVAPVERACLLFLPSAILMLPPMYWFYSYWGGGASALATAILLNGAFKIQRGRSRRGYILFGLGTSLLFLTRPYEGGVIVISLLAFLAIQNRLVISRATALAISLPLLFTALFSCLHNYRVVGKPLLLPYIEHDSRYNVAPVLWILPLRTEPKYANQRLSVQHGLNGWETEEYRKTREGWGPLSATFYLFSIIARLSAGMWILMIFYPVVKGDGTARMLLVAFLCAMLALMLESWQHPHYTAPAFICALALIVCVGDRISQNPGFAFLLRSGVVIACLISAHHVLERAGALTQGQSSLTFGQTRANLVKRVTDMPGLHLIFVGYSPPDAHRLNEWVYNTADLASQRVIFAHDLGSQNPLLMAAFPGRICWKLIVTEQATELVRM